VGAPLHTKDTVAYDQVVAFLQDNVGLGFEVVNLHGGEPTVHPRFLEALELIRSLGYSEVHLQTNGIRLANLDFARRAVDLGVRLFIVSLHDDAAAMHDEQTGVPGGFGQTIQGIRNVKALGALVRTNTVVTLQNVDRLAAIAELAVELGVDHLNFSNLHPVGSALFGLSRRVATFAGIRRCLYPAADLALARGRRVTLEGFPYCTVSERVDLHLDNEYREVRMLFRGRILENYDAFMNEVMRTFGEPCNDCAVRAACGGVYTEYTDLRGWGEFAPIQRDGTSFGSFG
jgi:MoaA/NifB/PqqE/SkfB family radical SAM enzyme